MEKIHININQEAHNLLSLVPEMNILEKRLV
jgi:hypothetical protein